MDSSELKYSIAFNKVSGVGRARMALLEGHFGSLRLAWEASSAAMVEAGLDRRTARRIATRKEAIDPAAELGKVEAAGVRVLTWHDADYPARLGEIYDKPPLLFVRGKLDAEDERSVAVVGTRRPSAYGRQAAYQLTFDLARAGVTVVRAWPEASTRSPTERPSRRGSAPSPSSEAA